MSRFDFPFDTDVRINGTLSVRNMVYPDGQITKAAIQTDAGIEATKVIHQHALRHSQKAGTAVVAETVPIHVFRSAAEIVAVEVVPITPPAGGDLAYTVDVQLGNASTAFASILSGAVAIDSADAARTPVPGTLVTNEAADGDTLQVVVAVSGSTGTQGQGFIVVVWVREEP